MLRYIIRRILLFIPTLIAISLLAFIISVNAPGDPVERMVSGGQAEGEVSSASANLKEQKRFWRKKLGLDLPLFYFGIGSLAAPDTLYKIYDRNKREALARLIARYGNWKEIQDYYQSLLLLDHFNQKISLDENVYTEYSRREVNEAMNAVGFEAVALRSVYRDNMVLARIQTLEEIYGKYSFLNEGGKILDEISSKYRAIKENTSIWRNYVPVINFYGNNQYHCWVFGDEHGFTKGIIRGDFGISYITKQPVSKKIGERIFWSLLLTLVSVFFAYLVSIPLGIKAAVKKDSTFDRVSGLVVFILYSMPSFWVAVLLLMIFANPSNFADHAAWLPASGVKPASGYPEGAGIIEKLGISLPYLVLPLICYTYSSFAFLSRTMRVSMLEVIGLDYIRTARAKGLLESQVIYKHGLRNALLPIITVFANIFPVVIGGSVIIESIFTIPGMGNEIVTAIYNKDYPMIIAVFTLTGMFTIIGFLIADILYAIANPRISFSKK